VFVLALWLVPALRETPVVALASGAATALIFNFVSARTLAFRGSRAR
jgi:putative flippase GtrA